MKKTGKTGKTGKEATIVGVVEEYEDEEDVPGLIIGTDDDDYVVELNKQGKKLFQEIGMDVEVTGFVTKNKDGTKRINVTRFEVFEDDDDDDEDDTFFDNDDDTFYDDDDDTFDDDGKRRWF
ncbi:MAG: hypothetical protein R6W88_09675 [Desulfobacterales bacterium]